MKYRRRWKFGGNKIELQFRGSCKACIINNYDRGRPTGRVRTKSTIERRRNNCKGKD